MSLFTDASFPAAAKSLYHKVGHRPSTHQIANWKRPSEARPDLSGQHALFVGGSGEGDIRQGHLGTCYFLGALSVVATRPELLSRLFDLSRCDPSTGRYVVRFFKNGRWVDVEIDDLLPRLQGGALAYASCPDDRELWVPLCEKAYAKLHGTYQMIEGGSVAEALVDLTGGASEVIAIDRTGSSSRSSQQQQQQAANSPGSAQDVATGRFWERLLRYHREGFLMGCGIASATAGTEGDAGRGLIANHAYGVIDVREVGPFRLIRVRNPWGRGEWTGAWSDGSLEWSDEIKRELRYEFADDGTFWMEHDDFVRSFNKLYVCRLYDDAVGEVYDRHVIEGEWVGLDAGGCLDHDTWRSNPQWLLRPDSSVTRPYEVFVVVSQEDARMRGHTEYKNAIGVYAFRTNRPHKKMDVRESERIADSGFAHARSVSMSLTVEPGQSCILMPCGYTPEQEGRFVMTVFAPQRTSVTRLEEPRKSTIAGEWKGPSAGGCPNFPSWVRNPQFYLMPVRPQATFTIVLSQGGGGSGGRGGRGGNPGAGGGNPHPIGFQVARCTTNSRLNLLMGDSIIGQSEYVPSTSVSAVVHTKDDTRFPYVVVPSTFQAAKHGSFTLTVYCDQPFALAEAVEGGSFVDLERILEARAAAGAYPADEGQGPAGFQVTNTGSGRSEDTVQVPARFRAPKDNPLYRTTNSAFGSRKMADHEKPVQVFGRSQAFSRAHAGNFRGTGMN